MMDPLRMQTNPRFPEAETEDLPRELTELGLQIAALTGPQQRDLEAAFDRVVDSVRRRRRILALVQEALSQLRLDIKYLMFDLEVTRQERDELRSQMEDL
jgi:phosphohistidine phosphatase SixA